MMVYSTEDINYRQCAVSVMDNIADPDISFDEKGISNYYHEYKKLASEFLFTGELGQQKLTEVIDQIKQDGKGKPYDCVTGISGGVDSSYLVWMAKKWNLRPLIVHFDNGWNSEISVANINNIIKKTGFDLYTIVVDWEEFKDLQIAYLKSSVVDIEVPTDHAIGGTLQKMASKYKLKYILSGNNLVTEAILPPSWYYNKNDYVNLYRIHKKFGKIPFKTYPYFGLMQQQIISRAKGIQTIKPLNFIDYNKELAKKTIIAELDWKDYGGKHYESIFTKFYQAYILPTKFCIDKRKPHLSTLIFSGQLSKQEALVELEKPLFQDNTFAQEKEYVLKKLNLSALEFEMIMKQPRVEHQVFGKQQALSQRFYGIKLLRRVISRSSD
jgi:N-acetyl sugar amidotransferase